MCTQIESDKVFSTMVDYSFNGLANIAQIEVPWVENHNEGLGNGIYRERIILHHLGLTPIDDPSFDGKDPKTDNLKELKSESYTGNKNLSGAASYGNLSQSILDKNINAKAGVIFSSWTKKGRVISIVECKFMTCMYDRYKEQLAAGASTVTLYVTKCYKMDPEGFKVHYFNEEFSNLLSRPFLDILNKYTPNKKESNMGVSYKTFTQKCECCEETKKLSKFSLASENTEKYRIPVKRCKKCIKALTAMAASLKKEGMSTAKIKDNKKAKCFEAGTIVKYDGDPVKATWNDGEIWVKLVDERLVEYWPTEEEKTAIRSGETISPPDNRQLNSPDNITSLVEYAAQIILSKHMRECGCTI